ncbi:MAG: MerR family transcriptional regulator [Thermoleophilaceae bacterium]
MTADGADGMLKMRELADRSGVSAGTIKHYLREDLLGRQHEIVRTSRNMAYYPVEYVERIRLIKRRQEERFMPLKHIRQVLGRTDDLAQIEKLVDTEGRILRAAVAASERPRTPRKEVLARYELPANVLDRLAEVGAVSPTRAGYDPDDLQVVEAIVRFRAGGYDETLGFTVYDTVRYREALEPLVREEVRLLLDRLAGEVSDEQAADIIRSGAEPLRELIGALHSKLLVAELERAVKP